MFNTMIRFVALRSIVPVMAAVMVLGTSGLTYAQEAAPQAEGDTSRPVLVISNSPVPKSILEKAYSYPVQGRDITPAEVVGSAYYKPTETMVSRKLRDLKSELAILQDKVVILSEALAKLQRQNESQAASYFAAVATINTQLQVGTTPGNPRLLERFSTAEQSLETLAARLADFNDLAIDASKVATEASFLLDSARATYGLSGAIEEDHVELAGMEDKINTMIVLVERVLNTVSDDISRTSAYLTTERDNLRTLSLAVANGTLYGQSLADRPFSGVRDIRKLASSSHARNAGYAPYAAPAPQVAAPTALMGGATAQYQQPQYQQPQPIAYAPTPVLEDMPMPETFIEDAPEAMASDDMFPEEPVMEPMPVVAEPEPAPAGPVAQDPRPLVKIRFDRSDVDFEQPLYMAVNEVLNRYPDASFNVVALHSSIGGAAETAIESTRSRRNAQKVIRTLSQIGVSEGQIGVSYDQSPDVDANEVHVYIY